MWCQLLSDPNSSWFCSVQQEDDSERLFMGLMLIFTCSCLLKRNLRGSELSFWRTWTWRPGGRKNQRGFRFLCFWSTWMSSWSVNVQCRYQWTVIVLMWSDTYAGRLQVALKLLPLWPPTGQQQPLISCFTIRNSSLMTKSWTFKLSKFCDFYKKQSWFCDLKKNLYYETFTKTLALEHKVWMWWRFWSDEHEGMLYLMYFNLILHFCWNVGGSRYLDVRFIHKHLLVAKMYSF